MRILIHSNAPFVPSGYGVQTRLILPRLKEMGHDVAVSALYGLRGSPISWDGFTIFPAGITDFGLDVIAQHAHTWQAELVITIMDFYKLHGVAKMLAAEDFKLAAWLPADCTPLSKLDNAALKLSAAYPVAMTRWGQKRIEASGFPDPLYMPHAVDTDVYKPDDNRKQLRKDIGTDDRFVIGICGANNDFMRKAYPEQIAAFAKFAKRHKDALLMIHSLGTTSRGMNLYELIDDFGVADRVMLSDQYVQIAGLFPPDGMAAWFGGLDVLSICSYGEGFGIPALEAQAVGTPVITTEDIATAELVGSGYTVKSADYWNPIHRANWRRPDPAVILRCYEKAYAARDNQANRDKAREFALRYDTKTVAAQYLKPVMDFLEAE